MAVYPVNVQVYTRVRVFRGDGVQFYSNGGDTTVIFDTTTPFDVSSFDVGQGQPVLKTVLQSATIGRHSFRVSGPTGGGDIDVGHK